MSNQATQGSADAGSAPTYTGGTQEALAQYLASNEAPVNAQLVGAAGTVNTVPHTMQRATQQIQNIDTVVPSNGYANHVHGSARH